MALGRIMGMLALACAVAVLTPRLALAGASPEILTNDGFAFSIKEDGKVTAFDPVAVFERHQTVPGDCNLYYVRYKGATWCFASEENKKLFADLAAKPNRRNYYMPFVGGRCTLGLAYGNIKAVGDPRTAIVVGPNILVLNGSFGAREKFFTDTKRYTDNALRYYLGGLASGSIASAKIN